jgi:hypothetical protein
VEKESDESELELSPASLEIWGRLGRYRASPPKKLLPGQQAHLNQMSPCACVRKILLMQEENNLRG